MMFYSYLLFIFAISSSKDKFIIVILYWFIAPALIWSHFVDYISCLYNCCSSAIGYSWYSLVTYLIFCSCKY